MRLQADYLWLKHADDKASTTDSSAVIGASAEMDILDEGDVIGSLTIQLTETEFSEVRQLIERVTARALAKLQTELQN